MFLLKRVQQTRIKAQIANALTLINLSFGISSILLLIHGYTNYSLFFIFLAALCDRFDGMAARYFNTTSDFGKELDSLSDLVSFGIAPALYVYFIAMDNVLWSGLTVVIIYILSGAIRLARYNVNDFDGSFRGLPITVAGVLMGLSTFLMPYVSSYFYVIATLVFALLMISNFRLAKM